MSAMKRRWQGRKRARNVERYLAEAVEQGRISEEEAERHLREEWKP